MVIKAQVSLGSQPHHLPQAKSPQTAPNIVPSVMVKHASLARVMLVLSNEDWRPTAPATPVIAVNPNEMPAARYANPLTDTHCPARSGLRIAMAADHASTDRHADCDATSISLRTNPPARHADNHKYGYDTS